MRKFFFWIVLVLYSFLTGCSSNSQKGLNQTERHYSDSLFNKAENIYKIENSRTTAFRLIDSAYASFPFISITDRCRYLDFNRDIFLNLPLSENSIDSAIQFTDSIIGLIEKNDFTKEMKKEYAKAFRDKGELYNNKHSYDSAIAAINISKQLALAQNDLCGVAKGMLTQCGIAVMQSKFTYAIELLHEAINYAQTCPADGNQFYMMQRFKDDLGYAFSMENKFDSALFYHLAAEKYILANKYLKSDDTLFPYKALLNVYDNISSVYQEKGDYVNAEKYINQSIRIEGSILKDTLNLVKSKIQLGYIYAESGRFAEALSMVKELDPATKNLTENYRMYLLQLAMKVTKSMDLSKEQVVYTERFYKIRDSLNKVEIELQRKDPVTQLERMDKKHQVELLQKDNTLKQNKIKASIIISSLLALLVAIILIAFKRIRNIMKKRAIIYKELIKSEQALKKAIIENEIQEKQKREEELYFQEVRLQIQHNEAIMNQRQKISEDLHDDLSSSLVALGFYVEDLKQKNNDEKAKTNMANIGMEIKSLYENARRYMHNLKASGMMSQFDLPLLLEEMKTKFSEKTSLNFELNMDKDKITELLSIHQHDQLYHIINEAITNIIKYAKATTVIIKIDFLEDNCVFSITDDGVGFNGKMDGGNGLGLKSMKKRLVELDGTLSIHSDSQGTKVEGQFPLY